MDALTRSILKKVNDAADVRLARAAAREMAKHCDSRVARIVTLYDAIAHGDDKHRAWLKQAIEDHFGGRPVINKPVSS